MAWASSARALQPQWQIAFAVRDAAASADPVSFFLTRSSPPSSDDDSEELRHFRDSDLWELPCFGLSELKRAGQLKGRSGNPELVCSVEAVLREAGLGKFDVVEAVEKVQEIVPSPLHFCSLLKLLKEPEFGPKHAVHTAIILAETPRIEETGQYGNSFEEHCVQGKCTTSAADGAKWFETRKALELLVNENANMERLGILAANAFYSFSKVSCGLKLEIDYQEYPPGMLTVPMVSRTLKPFSKTNLVIWAPIRPNSLDVSTVPDGAVVGDAMVVDPGCSAPVHRELAAIVRSLPRKLIVLITHHHLDHTGGLPAVRQENAEALVIAHERTLQRMGSELNGIKYNAVVGGTQILLRGEPFEIIDAPGHTDGHLCLFHHGTRTLVAGDHCVGEGSSIIDPNSGGNLHDYMRTSYRFLELGPKLVVPMHGRPNFWPSHLLKGYIKHRQRREAQILKAIEGGATTAFQIVSDAYKQTHISLWPTALWNVKSHVEHLRRQEKLPLGFSVQKFERSSASPFFLRWVGQVIRSSISKRGFLSFLVVMVGILYYFWIKPSGNRGQELQLT